MKKTSFFLALIMLPLGVMYDQFEENNLESLLPMSVLWDIMNEVSGEMALQNEILLTGVNRNRLPEEYLEGPFETRFILDKLKEYGIKNAEIIDLPKWEEKTWDAEMAELWIVEPEKRKIADLKEIAASLCSGSSSTDTSAELVYVGPGDRELFYEGKEVRGKVVLVNGSPREAMPLAVEKYGAKGLVAYSSNDPAADPDQVVWNSIDPEKKSFGFMVSTRVGSELRDTLELGQKVVVRAIAKAQWLPYREEMVSALLEGNEYPQEELVFVGHLFEGFAKQGANDNASGCVAMLETARSLRKLQNEGKIPPLRRSIRFLFVSEINGTAAYIKKYPEIKKRFFAGINEDMVGEALVKNRSYFHLLTAPQSLPTYLDDAMASFVEWVGKTQREDSPSGGAHLGRIYSPAGTRDPFYYVIEPLFGISDIIVFVDGAVRVPTVQFMCGPDIWYHSSGDTPDKSDSTQLKRVAFISVAMSIFLANAGPVEVQTMMDETSARGLARIGQEKKKAEFWIKQAGKKDLVTTFREAQNIVNQAINRENQALSSIRYFIKSDANLEKILTARLSKLEELRRLVLKEVEETYEFRCASEKIFPQKPTPIKDEIRLSGLVPTKTEAMGDVMSFWRLRREIRKKKFQPPVNDMMVQFELKNFIDDKRSIAEIRDAASAEYSPLPWGDVELYMKTLEELGLVKIKKKQVLIRRR